MQTKEFIRRVKELVNEKKIRATEALKTAHGKAKSSQPAIEIPEYYCNYVPDLPKTTPDWYDWYDYQTGKKSTLSDVGLLWSPKFILDSYTKSKYIPIPEEVLEYYKIWRPTPLFRAYNLEKHLDTPAHIYIKYEGVSPAGSHKLNSAIPQVYDGKKAGIKGIYADTGAGQWGMSVCMAAKFFDMPIDIFWNKHTYEHKPYRLHFMQSLGANVIQSPSQLTEAGRELSKTTLCNQGVSIAEVFEMVMKSPDRFYPVGAFLTPTLTYQTVVGLEAIEQMGQLGEYPDIVSACVGAGSNFAGIALPFMRDSKARNRKIRCIAAESTACPTLTHGEYIVDAGSAFGKGFAGKMYTLGHKFDIPPMHAGGLRYHGVAPLLSLLLHEKLIESYAYTEKSALEAGLLFAKTEGFLIAPESGHALASTIEFAEQAKLENKPTVILVCLSGNGLLDMEAYKLMIENKLVDYSADLEKVKEAIEYAKANFAKGAVKK